MTRCAKNEGAEGRARVTTFFKHKSAKNHVNARAQKKDMMAIRGCGPKTLALPALTRFANHAITYDFIPIET